MAVLLAASDETSSADGRGRFSVGGFLAPVPDWTDHFTPAWEERVLNGNPPIPYLHMVDIRSEGWRNKYGLGPSDAERRVDEAARVINSMGSFFLLVSSVDSDTFRGRFGETGLLRHSKQPGVDRFEPDHLCFLAFAFHALNYAKHEKAEKVDFLVESKQKITRRLQEFHSQMRGTLDELGAQDLIPLVGDFLVGGKERVPLQAADMACWHLQRRAKNRLTLSEERRWRKIGSRYGLEEVWTDELVAALHERAQANTVPSPFKPKPERSVG